MRNNIYEGKPCRTCESTTRLTKTNLCVACLNKRKRTNYHKTKVLKNVRQRHAEGPETYEGTTCKKCKTTTRQVRDNRCLHCLKSRQVDYNIKLRESNFKTTHGCTYAKQEEMYIEQKGKCLICKADGHIKFLTRDSSNQGRLVVDHCHTSGKVRGLICNACNIGLGVFKDNTETLRSAIKYLDERN